MKLNLKRVLFFSFFLLLFSFAKGQEADITGQINKRFMQYVSSFPREEIFVHSDREEYIAGEDIWFNIYLIDRQTFKPSGSSNIAYFEILNHENMPVVQKRIRIDGGFGPGQAVIPDTLSSGVYKIRAYTSWMKNFMPVNCFSKDISIYNALRNSSFKEKKQNTDRPVYTAGLTAGLGSASTRIQMEADNNRPGYLVIRVTSDESWRNENSGKIHLLVQTHGVINYLRQEIISQQRTDIAISKTLLTPGINQIVLFNSKGQPVSEKYVYTPVADEIPASISSAESVSQRSNLSLEVDLNTVSSPDRGSGNISISVAPASGSRKLQLLSDYLVFGSEFGEAPWRFLNGRSLNELGRESVDSLMALLTSSWIDLRSVMSGVGPKIAWQPEENSHTIHGRLLANGGRKIEAGEFVTLSKPGKNATFQYGISDSEGNFSLNVPVTENLQDLVIQPGDLNKNRKVALSSSFTDKYPDQEIFTDSVGRPVPAYITNWSVNYQVSRIYESSATGDPLREIRPLPEPVRFYGKPDQELVMDDYIKLPVMDEVFFELIVGAYLKKKKTGYEITVSNPVDNRIYAMPPVIMVDGVIINDASIIGNLDPELVEKIDLVRERYFVGDYIFYGIVNVITRKGDFGGLQLSADAIRVPYRVIEPVWSFSSPDYSLPSAKNSRVADFRNTLYWNPAVKPDKDGKAKVQFWTSDVKTDYVITVHGINSEGKAVSVRKTITVK